MDLFRKAERIGLEIVHDIGSLQRIVNKHTYDNQSAQTPIPCHSGPGQGECGVPVYTDFASKRVIKPPEIVSPPASTEICENGSTTSVPPPEVSHHNWR
jgi:hypothetical protein